MKRPNVHFEGGDAAANFPSYSETLPRRKVPMPPESDDDIEAVPDSESTEHACHACGVKCGTAHGLARHIHAKHGYSGLGKAIRGK